MTMHASKRRVTATTQWPLRPRRHLDHGTQLAPPRLADNLPAPFRGKFQDARAKLMRGFRRDINHHRRSRSIHAATAHLDVRAVRPEPCDLVPTDLEGHGIHPDRAIGTEVPG